MSNLESGDVQIFDRMFKVYGFDDDAWYQGVKRNGFYGEFNQSNLAQLIGPSDVCLDLGANVGMMTLAMAMLAPKGHVYAFEGSPQTTLALTETVKANNLDNVSVYSTILGRSREKVKFFDAPEMRAAGFYVSMDTSRELPRQGTSNAPNNFQMIISETKSVDDLVAELGLSRVDFIKIDVEGAELDVLEGARDTLQRFKPIVIMEFNSYTFTLLRDIPPRRALKKILETFDDVYYFKSRTGCSIRIGNTEAEQERFLHDNLCNGFVDDLMCCFHGAELVKRGYVQSDMLKGGDEISNSAVAVPKSDDENSSLAVKQLQEALTLKQREIDLIYASTSWRLTAALRGLKRIFN